MAAFERTRADMPDALGAAWDAAVASWDDSARHDEVLRLVTQHDAYAWAAMRYRERVAADAEDAIGRRQLDRVRRAAEAALVTSGTPRVKEPTAYRSTIAILALLVIFTIIGFAYAVLRRGQAEEPPPPAAAPLKTK
jgi:hypothetical protein